MFNEIRTSTSLTGRQFISVTLIYVIVSLPFVYYFYDSFNFNANVLAASNLFLGLNSYEHGSLIVAAFMMNSYNLAYFVLYELVGYNVQYAVIVIKLITMVLTIASALLLYKIAENFKKSYATTAFLAFLFNPFWILVDFIWVQPEIIPIFFLLLAYYVLHGKAGEQLTWLDSSVVAMSLVIAALTFYYPVFLIPSFLIYSNSRKNALKLLTLVGILTSPVAVITFLYHYSSTFTRVVSGGVIQLFPYSIIYVIKPQAYLLPTLQITFEFVFLVMAFLIPFYTLKRKRSLGFSLLIILSAIFFLQPTGINADSFVMVIPFLILSVGNLRQPGITYRKVLLYQSFLLPQFILVQLLNGPGYVSGIFYWLYPFLHVNYNIGAWLSYLSIVTDLLLVSSYLLWWIVVGKLNLAREGTDSESRITASKRSVLAGKWQSTLKRILSQRREVLSFIMVLLLASGALASAIGLSGVSSDQSISVKNNLPYMMFIPNQTRGGVYEMQSPGDYQYFNSNDTLKFWDNAGNIGLYRNTEGTSVNFESTTEVNFSNYLVGNIQTILSTSAVSIGESCPLIVNNTSHPLYPIFSNLASSQVQNVTLANSPIFLSTTNVTMYTYTKSCFQNYTVNPSYLIGKAIAIEGKITKYSTNQTILWHMQIGETQFESFIAKGVFYLGIEQSGIWNLTSTPVELPINQWFLFGIAFQQDGKIISFLDGNQIIIRYADQASASNASVFSTGKYSIKCSSNYSFQGLQCTPFIVQENDNLSTLINYIYQPDAGGFVFTEPASKPTQIGIESTSTDSYNVHYGSESSTINKTLGHVSFGKLSTSNASVQFSNFTIHLKKVSSEINYFNVVVIIGVVYPTAIYVFAGAASKIFYPSKDDR